LEDSFSVRIERSGKPIPSDSVGESIMSILGRGVYSLTEAARLTQLRPDRVREWFRTTQSRAGETAFQSDYPSVGSDRAVSFLDLIEVYIAGRLREADPPVSLQRIRKVHKTLSANAGTAHPFCEREIYHSGGQIFTRPLNDAAGLIIEPLTNQAYINDVIMPFLEKIEYDHVTNLAKLWHISNGVIVDPSRCFGKPIVSDVGIATRVLAAAYEANGRDANRVADWFEIEPEHVIAAVSFESRAAA
jgi:uncharacterized protein (DUF433 family)